MRAKGRPDECRRGAHSGSAACEINEANRAFVQRPNASGQAVRETPRRTSRYVLQTLGSAAKRDGRAMRTPDQHGASLGAYELDLIGL
jgi:hypothetical protein